MNHLSSIEDLHDVFVDDGKFLWRLYSGRTAKGSIIGFNKDDSNPETSWNKLEQRIMVYGNGYFSVATMEKYSTNNTAATIHHIKLGNGQSEQRTTNSFGNNLADTLMLMRYMDERSNRNQPTIDGMYNQISSQVKLEMENERLREKIKELERKSTASRVAEVAFTKLPRIIDHYFPDARGVAGELGYSDGPDGGEGKRERPREQPQKERYSDSVDFNVLVNAAGMISREIPNVNVNELFAVLTKLAIAIEKADPEKGVFTILVNLVKFIEEDPAKARDALGYLA